MRKFLSTPLQTKCKIMLTPKIDAARNCANSLFSFCARWLCLHENISSFYAYTDPAISLHDNLKINLLQTLFRSCQTLLSENIWHSRLCKMKFKFSCVFFIRHIVQHDCEILGSSWKSCRYTRLYLPLLTLMQVVNVSVRFFSRPFNGSS